MRVDVHGLQFEAPGATFFLWSPWRASQLEHKVFEALTQLNPSHYEEDGDERRVHFTDAKAMRAAVQAVARVLKGWQEEASDSGGERRVWRWLFEADTDASGYDHHGERACVWGFLRVAVDRGSAAEGEKLDEFDLESLGLQIWVEDENRRVRPE